MRKNIFGATRSVAVPRGVRGRHLAERTDHAFNDFVDLGEVALVLGVVEILDPLARRAHSPQLDGQRAALANINP